VIYPVVGQSIIVVNINIGNQRSQVLVYQTPTTDNGQNLRVYKETAFKTSL
jgi:hypothetical protein